MRTLNVDDKRIIAGLYLQAMDTLEKPHGGRYPDGIRARINDDDTVDFDTYKLVHGPGRGWISVDEIQDICSFGDDWEQTDGTYYTDDNIMWMIDSLEEWGKFNEIEDILRESKEAHD